MWVICLQVASKPPPWPICWESGAAPSTPALAELVAPVKGWSWRAGAVLACRCPTVEAQHGPVGSQQAERLLLPPHYATPSTTTPPCFTTTSP
jgi:hypothetical protein